ncbi:BMP family lipoprotein [Oribacterium sp. WCC10]|uniref:BMP family lipoprotein n=1 Tax=Oribacterium sp. WCC10 TaxID=1855343 RepID=UPI0008DF79E3|nr:BMP family ABC transporter substrate-binding protein [Oribacterium sp. WCC10]SFG62657.1 basic membrane protein A [Oribacterium sp. WCC10]
MKRRFLSVFMCVAMAAALTSCGGSAKPTDKAGDKSEESGLKIAIVSSLTGVDDGSFNEENYNGILSFIDAHPGSTVTPVQENTGAADAAVKAVEDIVVDYDVLVCDGFQFSGIGEVAADNPDKKFVLVDTFPTDAEGNEVELDNVYGMTFKEQEAGFLAGMAAALSTGTGKVAVVNGVAIPTNVNYQYGFMSGVNYANKHYGTGAEIVELASYSGTDVTGTNVGGNYIGSFADPANGKVVGDALIKEGCDIIFVAAGASGTGVLTAIKESSAKDYMIGCDTDQYDDGVNGSDNVMLTSALKIMGANDKKILETILDGSFKGGNYILGADTDSVGYVKDSSRCQLSPDTIEKIDKAYELIKNGTIVPAANFNDMTPDNFTGLDAE